MPRYYCDYCDTYLTHDSPSVRKQHNAGYKHKAAVRDYYMQFEAQQNQYLIDLKIKQRMQQVGQAAAYPQVGPVYNQMMRPQLSAIPTPVMPGTPQMYASNPGMRPPVLARPGFAPGPGMPQMAPVPTGTPLPGQGNGLPPRPMTMNPPGPPPLAPGAPPPSSGALPMFTSAMYQANPAAPTIGGFDSSNMNNQAQAPEASR